MPQLAAIPAHPAAIDGGFADPVHDAQACFRAIMDAMARPGAIRPLGRLARPPLPLSPEAGAVLLTLCDHDTPVWLDAALASSSVCEWLGFHAGAPIVRSAGDAHVAFVANPAELPAMENFTQGSQDYPDRSTTIVLQLDTLTSGAPLVLRGPGIETTAILSPSPLPRHFVEQRRQNHQRFPRGVDLILVASGQIAALPRTTRIAARED